MERIVRNIVHGTGSRNEGDNTTEGIEREPWQIRWEVVSGSSVVGAMEATMK